MTPADRAKIRLPGANEEFQRQLRNHEGGQNPEDTSTWRSGPLHTAAMFEVAALEFVREGRAESANAEIRKACHTILDAGFQVGSGTVAMPAHLISASREILSSRREPDREAAAWDSEEDSEQDSEAGHKGLRMVRLSEVEPEEIDWLWSGRIPYGKLTLLEGDPGLGKSALTIDLAARVTRGIALPGGEPFEPATVIFLCAEDGVADTIRPRLEAAVGDPELVYALDTRQLAPLPSFPQSAWQLQEEIVATGARLVIVDPLAAFLGAEINSYRDQDVRRALAPLAQIAEATGAAIVVVRHLTKNSGSSSIYRGGGSIGIVGAARSAMLVGRDPDDDHGRVLAMVKSNLSLPAPSLRFALVSEGSYPRLEWRGESAYGCDALHAAAANVAEDLGAGNDAVDMLKSALGEGSRPFSELRSQARAEGISESALNRAAARLRVSKTRTKEFQGGSVWSLPGLPAVGRQAIEPIPSIPFIPSHDTTSERIGMNGRPAPDEVAVPHPTSPAAKGHPCAGCGANSFPAAETLCFTCRRRSA